MNGQHKDELRKAAEQRLLLEPAKPCTDTPVDPLQIIHELHVHQAELEIQNQELRDTQSRLLEAKQETEIALDAFAKLFDEAPVGYAVLDERGTVVRTNDELRHWIGEQSTSFRSRLFVEYVHPSDRPLFLARLRTAKNPLHGKTMELRLVDNQGRERTVELALRSIVWAQAARNQNGQNFLLLILHDLTHRKAVEAELKLVNLVFEHSAEGILITDTQGRIQRVNPAFTRITGYHDTEVLNQTPRLLQSGRHDYAFFKALWADLLSLGRWEGEIWNRRKNGEIYAQWLNIAAVREEQSGHTKAYIGIFSDTTERKLAVQRIERLAHYDPLTELANRVLFQEQLRLAVARAKRHGHWLAIFLLDLDRFKAVNDTLGHAAGDELLKQVAMRLRAGLRASDTLARLGGDEFTVLLDDFTSEREAETGAHQVAENILKLLSERLKVNDHELSVTTSIGIALYPRDGDDGDQLLQRADTAMYEAKSDGRHCARFYTAAMAARVAYFTRIEQGLVRALRAGGFGLHYQPLVELATGKMKGVEALLRWNLDGQPVQPTEFVPIAEDNGLIEAISRWVLHEACAKVQRWRNEGAGDLKLSVNLSTRQFNPESSLLAVVDRILEETGLPPEALTVEITETVMMVNTSRARQELEALKSMGISVALDDFGTGYSSLVYLTQFPIDILKIDASFVRDIERDPADAAVVKGILNLATSLGLTTVAEGVETQGQCDFLIENGCRLAQGYFFHRPLDAQSLAEMISTA